MTHIALHEIHAAIESRQGELVELARTLIAFPTLSPPGRNTGAAQDFVAGYLKQIGFSIDRFDVYPGDPDIVGTLSGSDPGNASSLLINGHIDVAEVEPASAWSRPPFEGHEVDGYLYGRGAADMKGPVASALFAVQAVRDAGVDLRGDLMFQSVIGEEQGEAGTLTCVEKGYRADFAIVAEPTDLTIAGQGGVITGWVEIQNPETMHDAVRARTIHAGGGLRGASAIEKMVKVIEALGELERHWAVLKNYPGFAPGATTINPAVIEGGRHPAFLADRCALWVTVHFYPDETWEDVVAETEDHVLRAASADLWLRDNPPTFRWGGRSMIEERGEIFPAVAIPSEHPGLTALSQAHHAVLGADPAVGMWPSVSDAGWLSSAGIPTVIYGPGTLEQAHAIDERIAVRDLVTASKVYAGMVVDWCNREKP